MSEAIEKRLSEVEAFIERELAPQVNSNTETIEKLYNEIVKLKQETQADIAKNAEAFSKILDHAKKVADTFATSATKMTEVAINRELARGREKLDEVAKSAEAILQKKAVEACKETEKKVAAYVSKKVKSVNSIGVTIGGILLGSGIIIVYFFVESFFMK